MAQVGTVSILKVEFLRCAKGNHALWTDSPTGTLSRTLAKQLNWQVPLLLDWGSLHLHIYNVPVFLCFRIIADKWKTIYWSLRWFNAVLYQIFKWWIEFVLHRSNVRWYYCNIVQWKWYISLKVTLSANKWASNWIWAWSWQDRLDGG